MMGSRKCGLCAMPVGLVPVSSLRLSKAEQPEERLAFLLVWQRCRQFYSAGRVSGTPHGSCCGEVSYPTPRALLCTGFMVQRSTRQRGVQACAEDAEGPTFVGLPSEHTRGWPCSPLFRARGRAEVRLPGYGCWNEQEPAPRCADK